MKITSVKYLNEFPDHNNSPAMVNRKTGELFINLDRWKDIAFVHRVFIILHELAHVVLDSSDEMAVDALAHKWYIEMGYSLTESVYALTKVLHADSKVNYERSLAQYNRAKSIEDRNNLLSHYEGYDEIKNNPNCFITSIESSFDGESIVVHFDEFDVNNEINNLPGLSRKEMKKKKRAARLYKRIGRGKKKHAVANDIQAGADTRKIYADKGILVETRGQSISKGVSGAIQAVAGAVSGAMGGGAAASIQGAISGMIPQEPQQEVPATQQSFASRKAAPVAASADTKKSMTAPQSNIKKYALIGGIILAVIAVIIIVIKKK